ncbi:hypothetical protein [Sediminibacterium ginsengisoli]|uniref:Replication initiation factor n=1 Tax=Sediminibacterium ginsengisoli TaxID=413434 RepID=A0A1T4RYZ9_9BACT|nr:hypothetical protein [Sediminibacterium ginsengisoli]SKA21229.1 hypothetical protein SAMN04488132_11711 [Sediminibacterium ginsengisoli]
MRIAKLLAPPDYQGSKNATGETFTQITRPGVTYCMGFDWLEFTAHADLNHLPEQPFLFQHENTGHGTKYFTELWRIDTIVHGEVLPFAELEMLPRPSFLAKNLVKVKIANRFCYSPDLHVNIENFCREYSLTFLNYTRVDLFIDVQQIAGYSTNIQAFMLDCASRKLVMKGKSMKIHYSRNEVTGITWGSRSSGTAITMYNKTEEMIKKTWKPWIEQLWKESHFDMDTDVYRIEFSLKKPRNLIVESIDQTGEDPQSLFDFTDMNLLSKFTSLLSYYYHHHFQMAYNEPGVRFSRMKRYTPLILEATPYFSTSVCVKPKSTNYTKSFIKRLAIDALFYQKKGDCLQSSFILDHVLGVVERYSLGKWFHEKFHWLNLRRSQKSVFDYINNDLIKTQMLSETQIDFIPFMPHVFNNN